MAGKRVMLTDVRDRSALISTAGPVHGHFRFGCFFVPSDTHRQASDYAQLGNDGYNTPPDAYSWL